ncbi:FAD-dependent monooxygenase [Streptomyces diastatochromogenes]|nr:FAD-dependent monooxygenase [Streptomyces diastatochromogenes]
MDVCVVGAGPVGLTLAIGLRRLGLRVRIVDRAPAAQREDRALVLWARARRRSTPWGSARPSGTTGWNWTR